MSHLAWNEALLPAIALWVLAVLLTSYPAIGHCEPAEDSRFPGFTLHEIGGARVYFKRSAGHAKGAIAAVMVAGMGDQAPDEAHCAHMAEHMVLIYPTKSGDSVMSAVGGLMTGPEINANGQTNLDNTTYIMSVANQDVPYILSMFLDALFRTGLRADDDYLAEIKRARRELDYMTTEPLPATLNRLRISSFAGTPYEERLFETPLQSVTVEKVRAFIEREYSPSRLTLVVVADVEEAPIVETVKKGLEGVSPGSGPASREITLAPSASHTLELPVLDKPVVGLSVGIDGIGPHDLPDIHALANVVARRLYLQGNVAGMRFEPQLFQTLYASSAAIITFGYSPPTKQSNSVPLTSKAQEIAESVKGVLGSLADEGVDRSDLAPWQMPGRAEMQKTAERLYSTTSREAVDVAGTIAMGWIVERPFRTEEETLAHLGSSAQKYLPAAKITVVLAAEKPASLKPWPFLAGALVIASTATLVVSRRKRVVGRRQRPSQT